MFIPHQLCVQCPICAFTWSHSLSQFASFENFPLHECPLIVLVFSLQEYFSNVFFLQIISYLVTTLKRKFSFLELKNEPICFFKYFFYSKCTSKSRELLYQMVLRTNFSHHMASFHWQPIPHQHYHGFWENLS